MKSKPETINMVFKPENLYNLIESNYGVDFEDYDNKIVYKLPDALDENYYGKLANYFEILKTVEVDSLAFSNYITNFHSIFHSINNDTMNNTMSAERDLNLFKDFIYTSVIKNKRMKLVHKDRVRDVTDPTFIRYGIGGYKEVEEIGFTNINVWNLVEFKCKYETDEEFQEYLNSLMKGIDLSTKIDKAKLEEKIENLKYSWANFPFKGFRLYFLFNYSKYPRFMGLVKMEEI